ncbi:MAG: cytochrome c oxidase subunit II [Alphaproteobacteria bacterium]|nr:cytochrome c oxidase subunit II [Alphaproteobacteria bacterium]
MSKRLAWLGAWVAALPLIGVQDALAAEPRPWQMTFQPAASPVMEQIDAFHDLLFWIIVTITAFVLILLCYVAIKFNEKANPTPSKTTHNTALEVIWTAVPILILVVIAVPSFRLLYFMDKTDKPEMTLKIVSHQWYWSYQYPDHGGFKFDSNMIPAEDLKPGQPRLLAVDNEIVLPVDTNIRLLMTSQDVIHNWAIPAFGIKLDTVPGRTNETWVKITKEGTYYGQCSELCGINHGFMPIQVRAVSKQAFRTWTEEAKKKFAAGPSENPAGNSVKIAAVR